MPKKNGSDDAAQRREVAKDAAANAPEGLQILELYVENLKRVKVAHLTPTQDGVMVISGANGSGKSSVLDAILWALEGTGNMPTQPIRKGERVGVVKMNLDAFVVTRYFTAVDPEKSKTGAFYTTKLLVEGKHKEQYPNPQALLDGLMGEISFDPLAFIRMDAKKQMETLRGLVKFDIDIDAHDAAYEEKYEQRREAGREVDSLKNRLGVLPAPAEGLPSEKVDVAALTAKLGNAANHNSVVQKQRERKQQFLDDMNDCLDAVSLRMAKIAELEIEIEDYKEKAASAQNAFNEATVGDDADTAALAAELTAAQATNEAVQRAETYRALQGELEAADVLWGELDAAVKKNREDRALAIERAEMPFPELGIGNGEVLLKGFPFDQASNAEQIRASMALGMASNPKLRVLRICDGSLLDKASMKLIAELAKKNKFQVWIERVEANSKVGVVMEDGTATGETVVEAKDGK